MTRHWVEKHFGSPEEKKILEEERLLVWASEIIGRAMEDAGYNRADMAEKLGKSRSFISQTLNGTRNMTLRTLSNLAWVLDRKIEVRLKPKSCEVFGEQEVFSNYEQIAEMTTIKRREESRSSNVNYEIAA